MREYLKAVDGLVLLEDVSEPITETIPERAVTTVRNWRELQYVLEQSTYGQVRGIFDFETNSAYVGDSQQYDSRTLREDCGVRGIEFTLQHQFGGGDMIELTDDIGLKFASQPEDFSALSRLLDLTESELEARYWSWVDTL